MKKRENYRKAFDDFDVERIARYGQQDITRLLHDPGIVRNRLKIEAAVRNAQGVLTIREEYGTLDTFLWRYVNGTPFQNSRKGMADVPAKTNESDQMSKDLKKRGFNFVGSTICYAFMQAVGMVNDHATDCFRYKEIARNSPPPRRRTSLSRRVRPTLAGRALIPKQRRCGLHSQLRTKLTTSGQETRS